MSFLPRSSSLIASRLTRRLGRTHALVVTLLGTVGAVFGVDVAVRAAAAALMIAQPVWPPGDELMYGPHLVSATSGSEVWFEDRFSAEVLPGVTYHVKVRNPGVSGGTPVPNFSVKLNGVYYATKDSLTNGATEFTKQVPLQAWNKIELWIAAGSGQVSLEIYSQAGTSNPFTSVGPVKEIRPQAGLDTVNASWQVTLPPDAGPTHVLVIDNGALNRSGRVGCCEWGEVKLNGARVFWLDTLHTQQSKVMVPVTLQPGVNTLQVIADSLINGAHMHVRVMHAPAASSPPPADDLNWPPNDDVVYGPHTVSATSGSQVWFEDRFSAKVQSGVQYYVKVRNPSLSGGTAVPNFSVKLNGVYYAAKDSLQSGATEFINQVPLQTWNKIELWIAPGSGKMDLEVYSEPMPFRTLGPVEEIKPTTSALLTRTWQVTKPADAGPTHLIVIDNGAQDRTGRVGANEYGKIKLNGAIVFDVDTFHLEQAKAVVPVTLQAGVNTIEASGGNMGLGERFHVRAMYADTAKPKLVITQPAQNAVVSSATVTVSGTYQDSTWGEVRVGSAASHATIPITANGGVRSWSTVRTLVEGPNVIKVWAKDGAGNKADTLVRTVILDTQQPTLTVSAPAEGFTTTESSVTVSGSASDANGVSVTANGVNLPVDGAGNYSGSVPLVVGANAITVVATDGGGNTRSVVRNVTRNAAAAGVTVVTQGLNPATAIERDECLTIAAGDDAAYECGDLRLVHGLPTTRTMNRARTPTLIYNSRHSRPAALIAADVSVAAQHAADSLRVTVRIPNKQPATRNFRWDPAWSGGPSRRIVVPVTASTAGLTTGAYGYTLEVQAVSQGAPIASGSAADTLVIVDRTTSPFGAGWWLDGLEMLSDVTPSANQKLWVGGDGSTRVYTQQGGSNLWLVSPAVDRVDSLVRLDTAGGPFWRRKLRNGAFVEFSNAGLHVATENRLGQRTTFGYNGSLLTTIAVHMPSPVPPQQSVPAPVYRFNYTPPSGDGALLTSVDAPALPTALRQVFFAYDADTRHLSQITEKLNAQGAPEVWVGFTYDGDNRVIKRRNRRDDSTFFAFDEASLLREVAIEMRRTSAPLIVTTFCPAEGRSITTCAMGPQPLDKVYTWLDGPRTDKVDTTVFFLTRFGAPREIVNALGHKTTIERTQPRFPLLATAVVRPSAKDQDPEPYRVEAFYDTTRALLDSTRAVNPLGDGRNAVTKYTWHQKWDAVLSIAAPLVDPTTFEYDLGTGNRTRVIEGGDATRFGYHQGLVTSIRSSEEALDTLTYDVRGNLRSHTAPLNALTETYADTLGRDTLVVLPPTHGGGVMRTRTEYDWADRPSLAVSSGGTGTLADALEVRTIYDVEGNTDEVAQTASPDRNAISTVSRIFTYDAAHRKLKERFGTINAGPEWRYDPAGNVVFGGRTSGVTNTYDALNRLERRSGTDTSVFTYDALGNVKTANNEYAEVSRTYYRNGQLESETLRIATADSTALDFTKHQYQLFYTYDLAGRRESVRHPSQLRPGGTPNTGTLYTYDARTGQVETVTDVFGVVFRHAYDAMGRVDSLIRRSGLADSVIEARTYDLESRMKTRVQRTAAGADLRPVDGLDYDGRGKISVGSLSDEFTYHALGHLTHTCLYTAAGRCEDFELDALGNRKWSHRHGGHQFGRDDLVYQAGTGRLRTKLTIPGGATEPETTRYEYDVSLGNVASTVERRILQQRTWPDSSVRLNVVTASIYDVENRLTLTRVRIDTLGTLGDGTGPPPLPYNAKESYRYDALGRRIWQRSYKDASCPNVEPTSGCKSHVTRTIWDGDDILYEIRTRGEEGASASVLEDDSPVGFGAHYGVVGYTHGGAIDQPLGLFKSSTQVMPLANYRGLFDRGTCPATPCSAADIYFSGSASGVYGWPSRASGPPSWYGSLIEGQEDASGLQYKRNRYYDPQSGRFTQEDPIGLAGGLNLYGFAEGDPVTYSDPFGLCPPIEKCLEELNSKIRGFIGVMGQGGPVHLGTRFAGSEVPLPNGQTLTFDATTNMGGTLESNGDVTLHAFGAMRVSLPGPDARVAELTLNLPGGSVQGHGMYAGVPFVLEGNLRTQVNARLLNSPAKITVFNAQPKKREEFDLNRHVGEMCRQHGCE